MFELNSDHLARLLAWNAFAVPDVEMVFWGLRGALPTVTDDYRFAAGQKLDIVSVDYEHPRCTLIQWLPRQKQLALFPGSTVPHQSETARGFDKANEMLTGLYADYRKDTHKRGDPNAHEAFVQTKVHPYRRSADPHYDENDPVMLERNVGDNIHAGWCQSIASHHFGSAGCQVVVGFPKCEGRPEIHETAPWRVFRDNAYEIHDQVQFTYVLLPAQDAQNIVLAPELPRRVKLRFGSSGPLVTELQEALKARGFYPHGIDDSFGPNTTRAVLAFQKQLFGLREADGIVGGNTAAQLGLEWPEI